MFDPIFLGDMMAQQGHWRRLKPNHVGEGRFGEKTQGKTWVDRKETKKTLQAKKKGAVPSPQLVTIQNKFAVYGVPGGRFAFIVHITEAKKFEKLTRTGEWHKDKSLRNFMIEKEKEGKFSIIQTKSPILDYDRVNVI